MLISKIKFYLMRSVRRKWLRDHLIKRVANKIGKGEPFQGTSFFISGSNDPHVKNLKENGYTELDKLLGEDSIRAIENHISSLNCFDPFNRQFGDFSIDQVNDVTHVANYKREELITSQEILSIVNDPGILNIVQDYLGAKPTISNVNMWWSMGGKDQAKDAQLFHRDVDDFKFCKLFVYLTDVDEDSGPHTYVKGSSASPKLRKIRRYQDNEIKDAFGADSVLRFTRPKGSMFIVDTYGFHKGLLPKSNNRLLLQIQYSLNPIGIEVYKPIKIDHDFNKYTNRLILQ